MDINDLRGLITAVVFLAFIAVSIWAFSKRKKKSFEQNAQIPFNDEITHEEKRK